MSSSSSLSSAPSSSLSSVSDRIQLPPHVAVHRRAYLRRFGGADPTEDEQFFDLPTLRLALREIRCPTTQLNTPLSKRICGHVFTAGEYAYLYVLYTKRKRNDKGQLKKQLGGGGGGTSSSRRLDDGNDDDDDTVDATGFSSASAEDGDGDENGGPSSHTTMTMTASSSRKRLRPDDDNDNDGVGVGDDSRGIVEASPPMPNKRRRRG